jgi:VanZ family protein
MLYWIKAPLKGRIRNGFLVVSTHFRQTVMRILLLAYSLYLTILLLSQDPAQWIVPSSSGGMLIKTLMPVAHMLSFALLSLLTLAACFPLPQWIILLILAVYGGATEIVQSNIPHRSSDWADWFQDLCGITIGLACFWLVFFLMRMMRKTERLQTSGSS